MRVFRQPGSRNGCGRTQAVRPPFRNLSQLRALTADEKTVQALLDGYAEAMEDKSVRAMEPVVIPGDFSTIESGYPNWTWEDFRDNHLLIEMDTFTDVDYTIELISGELQDTLGFAIPVHRIRQDAGQV